MGSANLAAKTSMAGLSACPGSIAIACAQDNQWRSGRNALFRRDLRLSMGSHSAQIPIFSSSLRNALIRLFLVSMDRS
jgi:hypothetical protein